MDSTGDAMSIVTTQRRPRAGTRHPARRAIGVGTLRINARAKTLVARVLASNRLSHGPMMQRPLAGS